MGHLLPNNEPGMSGGNAPIPELRRVPINLAEAFDPSLPFAVAGAAPNRLKISK
jgi:hypothetical protein